VLRDPKLVFLAAVVGVPWQDIANDPADLKKGYRPVEELAWTKPQFDAYNTKATSQQTATKTIPPGVTDKTTVWDQILGKVNADPKSSDYMQIDFSQAGNPTDPLMIESIEPRTGTNPATNAPLADINAPSNAANPVNGHEWDIKPKNDLQYACVFKLPPAQIRDCAITSTSSCDCGEADGLNNPLCQNDSGAYGKMQYRAKAYPGRRHLAVLHGLSPTQAIAASICPANTEDNTQSDYGYRPAIGTIIDRLRAVLAGTCWGQQLEYDKDGAVPCIVLEGTKYPEGTTSCPKCEDRGARTTPDADAKKALEGNSSYVENGLQCVCEIPGAKVGPDLTACIDSAEDIPTANGVNVSGWCYVDPSGRSTANANLVLTCPSDARRMIRFVGDGNPQSGSLTFLQCKGASFGQ
jgi:hypothetical protein